MPDFKTKRRIFNIHTSRMTLAADVDLEEFVMAKDELSGADVKAMCTEAGLLALRERRMKVLAEDFRKAKEKVLYQKKEGTPEAKECRKIRQQLSENVDFKEKELTEISKVSKKIHQKSKDLVRETPKPLNTSENRLQKDMTKALLFKSYNEEEEDASSSENERKFILTKTSSEAKSERFRDAKPKRRIEETKND
ncbi:26S proteasome regulatory subunit 4, partial [Nowakowskiella sp. JEL0078]